MIDRSKLTLTVPTDNIPSLNTNNLKITRGDSQILEFDAIDPNDCTRSVSLQEVKLVKFSLKTPVTQGQTNSQLVLEKNSSRPGEITTNKPEGVIFVELLPKDTVSLDPGEYWYDVQLTYNDGSIITLVKDYLRILEDITLEGTPAGSQYDPVLTSQGQYFKRQAENMLRVLLKDYKLSPKVQAFDEDELSVFLDVSLSDFNAQPTFTSFTWNNMEFRWLGVIVRGAFIMGLYAQGLLEQGREFTITDNGIAFTPPGLGAYMQSTAGAVLAQYQKEKEEIKANMKPAPQFLGTFRTLNLLPSFIRLRHLRERMIL